jgi:hypothetical protein
MRALRLRQQIVVVEGQSPVSSARDTLQPFDEESRPSVGHAVAAQHRVQTRQLFGRGQLGLKSTCERKGQPCPVLTTPNGMVAYTLTAPATPRPLTSASAMSAWAWPRRKPTGAARSADTATSNAVLPSLLRSATLAPPSLSSHSRTFTCPPLAAHPWPPSAVPTCPCGPCPSLWPPRCAVRAAPLPGAPRKRPRAGSSTLALLHTKGTYKHRETKSYRSRTWV